MNIKNTVLMTKLTITASSLRTAKTQKTVCEKANFLSVIITEFMAKLINRLV